MKRMLEELQQTPSDSPRYPDLIKAITANFDEFKESSSHNAFNKGSGASKHGGHGGAVPDTNGGGGAATKQEADAAFLNYTYKKKPVRWLWFYAVSNHDIFLSTHRCARGQSALANYRALVRSSQQQVVTAK